jgi:hypothetical protein
VTQQVHAPSGAGFYKSIRILQNLVFRSAEKSGGLSGSSPACTGCRDAGLNAVFATTGKPYGPSCSMVAALIAVKKVYRHKKNHIRE